MSDTKHTPLTVNETGWPSIQRDGVSIAKTDCSIGGEPWERDHDKAIQNARDLVHRYNHYPALLAALLAEQAWRNETDHHKSEELRVKASKLREEALATARA